MHGEEETFVDTGLGLSKTVTDKNFRYYDATMDGEVSWLIGRLQLTASDVFDGDIYTDKNQLTRTSNWQNNAKLSGDYFINELIRMKGSLTLDTFEDQSFPQFSTDDFGGVLELERKVRRNVFLTLGYEVHDLNFKNTTEDDYYQQDAYLSFFRFSPEKNTIKVKLRRHGKTAPLMMRKEYFKDGTRQMLTQYGMVSTATYIPEVSYEDEYTEYLPFKYQSNFSFELEGRVRKRELFNALENTYLEGQINGTAQFFFNQEHFFKYENNFSDRDYARQNLPSNLLNFQRNIGNFQHYFARGDFVFDHRLKVENFWYKDQPDYDSFEWIFDSSISWDLLKNWNVSAYHSFSQIEYDLPRQFFTSNEFDSRSLITTWKFNRLTNLVVTLDEQKRSVKFFENSIDSTFRKKGSDYKLIYRPDGSRNWAFHGGYRWERERHSNFQANDRYEQLSYIGARFTL